LPLGHPAYRSQIGYVPDGPYFYDHLNAPELLRFYGTLFGLRGKDLEARIERLLVQVGMADRTHFRVHEYSKGMLQRVGLAQALINDPTLVFLDEPTAGLDPMGAIQMRQIILKLRDEGKTVFLCSHLLKDMEPMCDRVAILNKGQLKLSGRIGDLLTQDAGYRVLASGVSAELEAKVVPLAASASEEDGLRLYRVPDQGKGLEIARLLAEGGAQVQELGRDRRTLEEVFINVVEGQAGD
jgi:ABC-2 type transport system ATP-binding protein